MESRCSACGSANPFLHFISKPFISVNSKESCSAAAPQFQNLVENVDVVEILERNLYRLMKLSKELGMPEFYNSMHHAFDGIQEVCCDFVMKIFYFYVPIFFFL